MKGDYTRQTFRPEKHYSAVRMQQGRVQTDADWNEQIDIQSYFQSTANQDLFGSAGAPVANPGFAIQGVTSTGALTQSAGPITALSIGAGRFYVCGILCENEAAVDFARQPDLPQPAGSASILTSPGVYCLYLEVWPRHITALEDPAIREVALSGPDTGTRIKSVWQVKSRLVPSLSALTPELGNPRQWPAALMTQWTGFTSYSPGLLSAEVSSVVRRLGNQLYRVEVHSNDGTALVLKWSRDNAALAWRHSYKSDTLVTLSGASVDSEDGLAPGQLVELTDDDRELRGEPGLLFQVVALSSDIDLGLAVTLGPLATGALPAQPTLTAANLSPASSKLRRWDGTQLVPLSGANATVPSATKPVRLGLESGLSIQLWGGTYRPCDYWLFTTRSDAGLDWPRASDGSPSRLPPDGIVRRYAPLALVQIGASSQLVNIVDCRYRFPSLSDTADARTVSNLSTQLGTVQSSVNSLSASFTGLSSVVGNPVTGLAALSSLIADMQEDVAARVTLRTSAVFAPNRQPALATSGSATLSTVIGFYGNSLQDLFLYQPWVSNRPIPEVDVSAQLGGFTLRNLTEPPAIYASATVGGFNGDRNGIGVQLTKSSGIFDGVNVQLLVSGRLRSVRGVGAYSDPTTGQVHVFASTRLGDLRHRTRGATPSSWGSWINRGMIGGEGVGTPVPFYVNTGGSATYQGVMMAAASGVINILSRDSAGNWWWDQRSVNQDYIVFRPAPVVTPPVSGSNGFMSIYWFGNNPQSPVSSSPLTVMREVRSGADGYTLSAGASQPNTTAYTQLSQTIPSGVFNLWSGPIAFSTPGGHFGVLTVISNQLWEFGRAVAPVPPAAPAAPAWRLVSSQGANYFKVCSAVFVPGAGSRAGYVSILVLTQGLQLYELRGLDTAAGILQNSPVYTRTLDAAGTSVLDLSTACTPDPNWPANSGARRCANATQFYPGGLISAAATGLGSGVLMNAFAVDMQDGSIHEYYATDPQANGAITWFWKYRGFLPGGTFPATDPAAVNLGGGVVGCFIAGANGHVFEIGPNYITDHGRPF